MLLSVTFPDVVIILRTPRIVTQQLKSATPVYEEKQEFRICVKFFSSVPSDSYIFKTAIKCPEKTAGNKEKKMEERKISSMFRCTEIRKGSMFVGEASMFPANLFLRKKAS